MVQSSDLARISTVKSTDFNWQSSDLARDLFWLNPQADLRGSSTLSGSWFDSCDRGCLLHNLSTDRLRFADGVSESWISQNTVRSDSDYSCLFRIISSDF